MNRLEQQALAWLEETREELFAFLAGLVSFDTQNFQSTGNERYCAEYLCGVYREMGLDARLYSPDSLPGIREHPGYLSGRGLENRPNADGVWWGRDRDTRVLLAAHTDTMPVGGLAAWHVDPFGGEVVDGRLYGLGAGDDKAGLAAAIFAVRALQTAGAAPQKTIVLNAYVDEEYGGGGGALAACLAHPYECILNLDGGGGEVWTAALGGGGFSVEIKRSAPTDTATPTVEALHLVLRHLEAMGETLKTELRQNPLYADGAIPDSAFRLHEFRAGNAASNLDRGCILFSIYTDKDHAAIQQKFAAVREEISQVLAPLGFAVGALQPTTRWFTYGETSSAYPAAALLGGCAVQAFGRPVRTAGACLSDLSVFLEYGTKNSLSFGIFRDFALPGGAHQPDEYVECEQLLQYTQALALFLLRYCCE